MPDLTLENARVLVTGASGFLGARLVRRLAGRCARVVALARGTASVVHPELRDVEVILGDVSVRSQIHSALKDIDVVFHFAGHSGARSSAADPLFDMNANVGGMISLLEAIRAVGRPCRVIFPGSRLEYGRVSELPVSEDAPLQPLSPYGVGKAACESYLAMYARSYGVSYAVARLTNPYGPWLAAPMREYNVINRMIATAAQGGTLSIYGDGSQLRDYVFVEDVVDALMLLAKEDENIVANVGRGEGISFRGAAEAIVRAVGSGTIESVPWPAEAERLETGDFVADITRMKSLGWRPTTSLSEGVRRTIEALAPA